MWVLWVIVALAALVGELLTTGLFLASFAVAAVSAAALSLVAPVPLQVAVFALLSLLLLIVVRPAALRLLPGMKAEEELPRIGPHGELATVTERITQRQGQIVVGNGEFWTARPANVETVIPVGAEVRIERVEGLTALVAPSRIPGEAPAKDGAGNPFGLSNREVEVLRLVALGISNQEIADRLFLSPRTVHHHVSHILNKMGASNRVEVVRLAMDSGLVRPGDQRT